MHLLVVEDDERLARVLKRLLEEDRHVVDVANDGETGLAIAEDADGIDVVILDVGLPDLSGLEVARRLRRKKPDLAILMLTARDTVGDRVNGLDAGADDYLVKPFAYEELAARLRAVSRRASGPRRASPVLAVGPIRLDETARRVTASGRDVDLSPREFSLLECLLRHPGQTLTRDQLLDQAWPFSVAVTPNAVDAYVHYLRTKLGDVGHRIETVRGVGYRLAMPDGAVATDDRDTAELDALAADARLVRRVRLRLVAWSGLTTLAVLLVLGAALYLIAAKTLEDRGTEQLDDRIQALRGIRPDIDSPGLGFIFGGGGSGTFAMVLNEQGQAIDIGRRPQPVPQGLPIMSAIQAAATTDRDIRLASLDDTPLRVLTEKVDTDIGPVYVQVIGDRTTEQLTLDAMLRVLLVGGAAVVLLALAVGTIYANRALVPIRQSLGAQRLALRRQREFAADASHELRTPLTVVRSSLEHLRRHADEPVRSVGDALDDIGAEVEHLTSLVDDLLLLARSDSGAVSLAKLPLDLGDVAADAASSLAKPAGAKEVRVVVDPEPAIVSGDAARLRQLVMILVDNAIRHSPTGGEVRVAVRRNGGAAQLDVDDEGRGVSPEDMPHVFERFWRASGAPSGGTGLGLAIAKWIVDRHDGSISVTNREGGGARFRVQLPAAPSA